MYWVFVRVLGAKRNINETRFFDDLSENFGGQAEQVALILLQFRGHCYLESEVSETLFQFNSNRRSCYIKKIARANSKS
jgi:hypothetical protein